LRKGRKAFNSLYWDFPFESYWGLRYGLLDDEFFQFPLLGFSL